MRGNKFWVIVIAGLLLVSCAAAAAVYFMGNIGHTVTITQQGFVVDTIHLDTVTTPYEFTLANEKGGYNVIRVEQGRICVIDASCPDHVCVHSGWLSDGVIPIVCLPNELVIQIEGSADGLDGSA